MLLILVFFLITVNSNVVKDAYHAMCNRKKVLCVKKRRKHGRVTKG